MHCRVTQAFSVHNNTQKQRVLSYPQEDIASSYSPTHFLPSLSSPGKARMVFDFLHGLFYPLQLEPVRNDTDW